MATMAAGGEYKRARPDNRQSRAQVPGPPEQLRSSKYTVYIEWLGVLFPHKRRSCAPLWSSQRSATPSARASSLEQSEHREETDGKQAVDLGGCNLLLTPSQLQLTFGAAETEHIRFLRYPNGLLDVLILTSEWASLRGPAFCTVCWVWL